MKSKLTITVASILSVLTLVGVGFAAWVISNPNVSADQNGTITAETVSDKSYTLEAVIAEGDKIVFGAPAKMEAKNAWLTADAKTQTEDLSATLTLTLKYKDWNYVPKNFSVTMNAKKDKGADTVFTSLRDGSYSTLTGTLEGKNFIANPKISYSKTNTADVVTAEVVMNGTATEISKDYFNQNASNPDGESDEKTATLVITITFGWGTYFTVDGSVVNPYTFYNGKDYGKEIGSEANTVLTAISNLSNVSYTVTIRGTTNTPNVSGK